MWLYRAYSGNLYHNGEQATVLPNYTHGDCITCVLDIDSRTLAFGKNGEVTELCISAVFFCIRLFCHRAEVHHWYKAVWVKYTRLLEQKIARYNVCDVIMHSLHHHWLCRAGRGRSAMTTVSCMSASFYRRRSRVFTKSIQPCVSQTFRLTFPQRPTEASSLQHIIIMQYHDVIRCHPQTYVDITQIFCFCWPADGNFNFTITDFEWVAWWCYR